MSNICGQSLYFFTWNIPNGTNIKEPMENIIRKVTFKNASLWSIGKLIERKCWEREIKRVDAVNREKLSTTQK